MRITSDQHQQILRVTQQHAPSDACVWLFGSRLDDSARGGDVDLMVRTDTPIDNPALLAATLSSRISRAMHGRSVDVVLHAPNLVQLPIHDVALRNGVRL